MKNEIAKPQNTQVARPGSIDEQLELFRKFGLAPTMAETHRIVHRESGFALVKRSRPIHIYEDSDNNLAVATLQQTYADRIHLTAKQGKYNDENRLFDQDSASIEVKEITPWAVI